MTKLYIIAATLITMLAAFTLTASANNGPPNVHSYEITSIGIPQDDGMSTMFLNEITVAAVFDRIVEIDSSETVQLVHHDSGRTYTLIAEYHNGSGTNIINFRYVVPPISEENNHALTVQDEGFAALGSTITVEHEGEEYDILLPHFNWGETQTLFQMPLVRYVRFASAPENTVAYAAGEDILVDVEFHANLFVSHSFRPSITLTMESGDVQADYYGNSSSNTLRFKYTVTENDLERSGIGIKSAALAVENKAGDLHYSYMPRKLPCNNHLVFEVLHPPDN